MRRHVFEATTTTRRLRRSTPAAVSGGIRWEHRDAVALDERVRRRGRRRHPAVADGGARVRGGPSRSPGPASASRSPRATRARCDRRGRVATADTALSADRSGGAVARRARRMPGCAMRHGLDVDHLRPRSLGRHRRHRQPRRRVSHPPRHARPHRTLGARRQPQPTRRAHTPTTATNRGARPTIPVPGRPQPEDPGYLRLGRQWRARAGGIVRARRRRHRSTHRRGTRVGPLHGVKVVELAGIGPGPFAGTLLSDMGAEVVRVERAELAASAQPAERVHLRRARAARHRRRPEAPRRRGDGPAHGRAGRRARSRGSGRV